MRGRGRSVVPHVPSFRGVQVAAGIVVLTVLVVLLQVRMDWGPGVHVAVAGVAAAGVGLLLAGLSPEDRPYVSALVACELVLVTIAIVRLAEVLTTGLSPSTVVWMVTLLGLVAAVLLRFHRAATATLVLGLGVVVWPIAVVEWLLDPADGVVRALLLLSALALALGAVATRDRRPTHASQLANAGGVAMGAIAAPSSVLLGIGSVLGDPGWGWQLLVLAAGFGLVAYGAIDRQRGPVLVGAIVLVLFCLDAGGGDGLLGWPLVLALVAAVMLVVGLRPTTPAPGPPQDDGEVAQPLPFR